MKPFVSTPSFHPSSFRLHPWIQHFANCISNLAVISDVRIELGSGLQLLHRRDRRGQEPRDRRVEVLLGMRAEEDAAPRR